MRRPHAIDHNIFRHKNREEPGYTHLAEVVLHTHEGCQLVNGVRNVQEQRVFMSISDIDWIAEYLQETKAELLLEQVKEEATQHEASQ